MNNPFLSIIIPAHNEESRLPRTLGRIFDFLKDQSYSYEVIIIENGSSDRTLALSQEFALHHPNLIVHQEQQPGKGNAVRQGMLMAKGQYRFICDADLSMPIEEIQKCMPLTLTNLDITNI